MAIKFSEKNHVYTSTDSDNIDWTSVTRVVSEYKNKFDPNQHFKSVKNKKSKWFGMDPLKVKAIWDAEKERSLECGNWYHKKEENTLLQKGTLLYSGEDLKVYPAVEEDNCRIASDMKLNPGCYPEMIIYLKSAKICGQSDKVMVTSNKYVHIEDYKTNKEIDMHSYKNWEGKPQMMLYPVDNLEDCNFYHYALQLSFYMYMICKHNPMLKPGKLRIHHITFALDHVDDHGFPVYKKDESGNFVISSIKQIDLPYLKNEVVAIIKHRK